MRVGHGGLGGRRLRPSGVAKIVFVHPIVLIIFLFLFLFVGGGGGVPRLRREDLFIVILFIAWLVSSQLLLCQLFVPSRLARLCGGI